MNVYSVSDIAIISTFRVTSCSLPLQEGTGLLHCPSLPHITTELPSRCFPGSSQLNMRMWLGGMGLLLSGKPSIMSPSTAGGRPQKDAGTENSYLGHEGKMFHLATFWHEKNSFFKIAPKKLLALKSFLANLGNAANIFALGIRVQKWKCDCSFSNYCCWVYVNALVFN